MILAHEQVPIIQAMKKKKLLQQYQIVRVGVHYAATDDVASVKNQHEGYLQLQTLMVNLNVLDQEDLYVQYGALYDATIDDALRRKVMGAALSFEYFKYIYIRNEFLHRQ